ncbi:MAG: hypothetical protein CL728_03550 [Chloroflexi bacterium]|nr:hypothetical protein [Chloroflexota bacterium]
MLKGLFIKWIHLEKMGNVKKGIYRDSQKRIIGGVCSGLSYYFNIDRVLIRLLFIIMVFFFMVAIPLYLIIWAIIPKARTPEEKLEMKGEGYISFNNTKFSFSGRDSNSDKNSLSKESKVGLLPFLYLFISSSMMIVFLGSAISVFFVDLIADTPLKILSNYLYKINGVFYKSSVFSLYSLIFLGKIFLPFVVLFMLGLKKTQKFNINASNIYILSVIWFLSVIVNYLIT